MKVKDFLKQFEGIDPELEIYRTVEDKHQHIFGTVSPFIPICIEYIHTKNNNIKCRYYAFKTKRYNRKILRIP